MLAETLMRQLFFGESHGVGIIRTFQAQCAGFLADPALEEALRVQIADESRHARAYARMLVKRGGVRVGPAAADPGWRTIVGHMAAAKSYSTTLIGIYGLMEPFNLLSLENLLRPLLDASELAEVDQIARDEARHIGMFDVLAELVERRILRVDAAECTEMIRVFFDALKDGIALPSGERARLPRGAWRDFMRHAGQLVDRIATWHDPASPSLSSATTWH